jgi:hypothetical protein
MGVTLHYRMVQPVSESVGQAIRQEAKHLEQARGWWTEPIHFVDPSDYQSVLTGFSKVPPESYETLDGRSVTIERRDWTFMTYWDFRFIITTLCRWSARYGLEWELSCEGEVGTIKRGEVDRKANKFLRNMAKEAQASADERVNEERNKEISERYASWLELSGGG